MISQESVSTPTFERLCELEPRLLGLASEIRSIRDDSRRFCANRTWYRDFEVRFNSWVGWYAWNPGLRNEEAYNVAFQHLYRLLPGCRDCTCL
jgi:hypothetical protein